MDVNGKVILITGGAGGIGLAMVKKLLENGAKGVAIVDSSAEAGKRAVTELGKIFDRKRVILFHNDVTVKKELEYAFECTVKNYNQLDIVINNAGIVDELDWKKTIAVNFTAVVEGTYLAMEKYLPKYKSGEEGVIVNTASILGFEVIPISPMYCATKHGLIGFGRSLGCEKFYEKYKVRILTICPGLIETPLTDLTEQQIFFPEIKETAIATLNEIAQSPDLVGEALIEIIKKGKNGSLWVTEDNEPVYEVVVPKRKSLKV